jgi:uncharacterized protein YggE
LRLPARQPEVRTMTLRLILLVALLLAAPALADPFPKAPHVYVEGSAEIRVEPDTLELSLVIEATDPQIAAAKARVDERSRKLIAACREIGIKEGDITSMNLQIGPAYGYAGHERKFLGTRVYRPIEVILRDLDSYPELIKAIVSAQIGEITSATLTSSKADKTLDQAQQLALSDARARAERLATASGQELGAAYSISEFNQRANQRYLLSPAREIGGEARRRVSDVQALGSASDSEPFEPGTIVATATVYVIYLLEKD